MADEKVKQKRIKFTKDDVLEVLGLVNNENPFADPEKWVLIVNCIRERHNKEFTLKNVREKVLALIKEYRERDRVLQVTSGKEEGFDELDQRLQTASDLKKEFVDANPVVKKRKRKSNKEKDQRKEGQKIRLEAALQAYCTQETGLIEVNTDALVEVKADVFDVSQPDQYQNAAEETNGFCSGEILLNGTLLPTDFSVGYNTNRSSSASSLSNPEKPTSSSDHDSSPITRESKRCKPCEPKEPRQPTLKIPSLSDDPVDTPNRAFSSGKKKKGKKTVEKECWEKLAADRELQISKINLEIMKAENERRKLEIDREIEMKKIELQEQQLNLMKEHAGIMASAYQNLRAASEEDRDIKLRTMKIQEDQSNLMKQLNEELKNCVSASQSFQERVLHVVERLSSKHNVPKLSSSYRTLVPIPKHGRTKYLLVSSEGSKVNYQMKPIDTLADQHHLPKTTEREKKENCCEMETPAKKRIVVNPRTNWTKRETDQFLQLVVNLKDKFEKPTARLFYTQLAAKEPTLSSFYWTTMRDKMKNLRNKYKSAIAWRNNTGAGLDAEDKERTIRDNILKLCPQFDALEELFGERPSTSALPLFTFDSDDTASTDADVWIDSSLEVVLPLAEDEGVGSGGKSPATTLPTSSALPTASRTLQDQHATLGQPSSPPCSFSAFKRRKAKKPFSKQITKPTSSLAHLNQINLDLSEAMKYKADKEAETEDRRMQLEREKFQWQRRREERLLKLEEKRILEETRLKQQELNYEILLEKFRIEKELELKKIERKEYDNNKKQD